MLSLLAVYLAGVLSVFVAEAVLLLFFIGRTVRRGRARSFSKAATTPRLVARQSGSFLLNKEGAIWVAALCSSDQYDDVKGYFNRQVKGLKEAKSKREGLKDIPEISPVQKYARIEDHSLMLTDLDGSQELIQLEGCHVTAVSGGDQSSRKWAKRYPIKLENKKRVLVCGSNICFIYLETAWEKEAWCKALRLASKTNQGESGIGGADWYCKLKQEFEQYLLWLNEECPSFLKLSSIFSTSKESSNKSDATASKVRLFLKKLAKKAKSGNDAKISNQEEKSISDKEFANPNNSSPTDFSSKTASTEKDIDNRFHIDAASSSSGFSSSVNYSRSSPVSDIDSENGAVVDTNGGHETGIVDQGILCWNLLFSRLFFDVKRNSEVTASIQILVQRLLSKVRTPSYIGGITCTRLDLGKLPPHICGMRIIPVNMDEAWTLEADVEYSGGALLDIETRLEVCEPGFQERMSSASLKSSMAGEATTDFLSRGFESLGEGSEVVKDAAEKKNEGEISEGMKSSNIAGRRCSSMPGWKAMLSHVADQVSQVPLALSIRVVSLKGTVRISIKPPPSDRIWFGFVSEPNIEWVFEPSIADHKITSGPIITFMTSRIKAAIRETLVFPNCEDVCIPWMIAEKDDWIPVNVAPFPWACQEGHESVVSDASHKHQNENVRTKIDSNASMQDYKSAAGKWLRDDTSYMKNTLSMSSELAPHLSTGISENREQPTHCMELSSPPMSMRSLSRDGQDDLMMPFFDKHDLQSSKSDDTGSEMQNNQVDHSIIGNEHSLNPTNGKPKKSSKRVKMMDLGKKMGDKLEAKSRHIVEKMRGLEKMEDN